MEMFEYLKLYSEDIPKWLTEYSPSCGISFSDVVSSRIAYYPGFGSDGSMLKVCNMSHSVHSFFHLDYLNSREKVMNEIDRLPGYHRIGHVEWNVDDILPNGFYPIKEFLSDRIIKLRVYFSRDSDHHIMTDILERDEDMDESYGAKRIALTTISADGIEFYYQVFVKEYNVVPWIMLLQDHGLGCNYNLFGAGGILHEIMYRYGAWPKFIICENVHATRIYNGYERIEDVMPIVGGIDRSVRFLYRQHNE